MKKCLDGLKVLELSQYISAPYAGQTLADFGAEVYKIETPGEGKGDVARKYDPYYNDMSLYFASYNRNKQFITLDLKQPEGKQLFLDMIKNFDVMIHNFRPGAMDRMGLGYEALKAVHPGLIVAAVSGYGQTGPYAHLSALDMTVQAQSGFMDITGDPDGPPTKAGPALVDFIGGMNLTIGILLALQYKQRTGVGQFVDTALFDSMIVLHENFPSIYRTEGRAPKRSGNGRPFSAPVGTYKTKDGRWIQISATADGHFKKVMAIIGKPELIDLPGMESSALRKLQEKTLDDPIVEWVANTHSDDVANALNAEKVPFGFVLTAEEVYNDPRLEMREMLICPEENVLGDVPVIGNPVKLSETPAVYTRSAVERGADNDSAYETLLGLSPERLRELREKGVI
ncbi:MAG: Acetyl-CoA:oxalate CoA-transferase [Desulfovibrio sp.]